MEIFRLDRIIPPMDLLRLMADNLHGGHRIHPCPSQIRACRVPKVMQPNTRNPRPTTSRSKGRPWVLPPLLVIQEDLLSV